MARHAEQEDDRLKALRAALLAIQGRQQQVFDVEQDHLDADEALLSYIDDPEVTARFRRLKKWYA